MQFQRVPCSCPNAQTCFSRNVHADQIALKKNQNRPGPLGANGDIYRPDTQVLARRTTRCSVRVCVCVCVCTVVQPRASYLLNRTLCTPAAAVPSPESQISPFGCEALGSSGRQRSLLEREEKFCEILWTLWRLEKSRTASREKHLNHSQPHPLFWGHKKPVHYYSNSLSRLFM